MKVNQIKLNMTAIVVIVFLVGGVIYVGNTWSPSSYKLALRKFEVEKTGLVIGRPRPIRSDEWTVATPLTQATVNNQFSRYNETSPYHEDLRTFLSMPIADWGLIFKPDMWLYRLVNPAYAFSFHHYVIFALFVIGYALLFNLIIQNQLHAWLLSFILFFTGYVQYWWTILGPGFALFPWLIVILEWKINPLLKFSLFYWTATSWILAIFYPPLTISLAFVGFVTILAFRPQWFQKKILVPLVIASLLAVGTAVLYLHDYLIATITTIYPGQRLSGGGETELNQWISQFFPVAQIHNHESLIGRNICEISTVGTFYTLAVFSLLNYSKWQEIRSRSLTRIVLILTGSILATWAWMFLPLPSWVGAPLLWNRIPSVRLFFAAGLLLLILVIFLSQTLGVRFSPARVAVFCGVTIAAWAYYKPFRSEPGFLDLLILLPVLGLSIFHHRLAIARQSTGLLVSALLVGFVAFGSFNPVQSAWLIFNRPQTNVTRMLDAQSKSHPNQFVVVEDGQFPGAVLNGWGYRSISHVLPTPQLDFFRQLFPELPEAELNQIFNRYARIVLTKDRQPKLLYADAVSVPLDRFDTQH